MVVGRRKVSRAWHQKATARTCEELMSAEEVATDEDDGSWRVKLHGKGRDTFATFYNLKTHRIAMARSAPGALKEAKDAAKKAVGWVSGHPCTLPALGVP